MTKLEVFYERLSKYALTIDEDDAMRGMARSMQLLDLNRKDGTFKHNPDYPAYLRMNIGDVMFYLLIVAIKRGACLECLSEDMQKKLEFLENKEKMMDELNIIVPQPKVTNVDNTGPEIKSTEE